MAKLGPMAKSASIFPSDGETVAELRELYRASEARAARLRLLSVSGRELVEANTEAVDAVLAKCADRLAFFVGSRSARLLAADGDHGVPIHAPGTKPVIVGKIEIEGFDSVDTIPDGEDRDTFRMYLDLMGATIDRRNKERERTALFAALQAREQTLETLLERIFTAQEEERRRVSHELHDGVAQTATALARMLDSNGLAKGKCSHEGSTEIAPAEVARGLVAELRQVIAGLRPPVLDDLGLVPALHALADALGAEGFKVARQLDEGDDRMSSLHETALYRVAQEAIANIRKHAGGPCDVLIEGRMEGDHHILRIMDHGCGPSPATMTAGIHSGHNVGIEVMKERMAAIGGKLDWRIHKQGGVIVEARLPI